MAIHETGSHALASEPGEGTAKTCEGDEEPRTPSRELRGGQGVIPSVRGQTLRGEEEIPKLFGEHLVSRVKGARKVGNGAAPHRESIVRASQIPEFRPQMPARS